MDEQILVCGAHSTDKRAAAVCLPRNNVLLCFAFGRTHSDEFSLDLLPSKEIVLKKTADCRQTVVQAARLNLLLLYWIMSNISKSQSFFFILHTFFFKHCFNFKHAEGNLVFMLSEVFSILFPHPSQLFGNWNPSPKGHGIQLWISKKHHLFFLINWIFD